MSFLNPAVLWALPLAAAPVLLHLIFLRRARRLPFGDLSLLREAYLRSLPSSRLRQWLLLATRCLLLAALVLAFARPIVHSGGAPTRGSAAAGETGAAVVFLADVSYSMGFQAHGKTRLEAAAEAARGMLSQLRPRDKAAVAAFSDRVEPPGLEWAADAAVARAALGRLRSGGRTTDFAPALQAAYALLRDSGARRRVIVVLSDGAAHGFRGTAPERLLEGLPAYDPGVLVLGLSWSGRAENAAVLSVEPEAPDRSDREALEARAWLSGKARRDWELSLWSGSQREDVRHVALDPGQSAAHSFPLRGAPGAAAWGRVELRRDALPADDTFHYALRTRDRPRVLLLYGGSRFLEAGRGGWFLKKLFGDGGAGGLPYGLDALDMARWASARLSDYRAVLLADARVVPPELGAALERFVRDGGGLLVIAGARQDADALRALAKVLPGRLGGLRDTGRSYGLRPAADGLPDAGGRFAWRDFELQNVAVSRAYLLEPAPGARVWFQDASGRPLMASASYGSGKAALWASSLDLEWTNLGLKPAFAAWADLTLGQLTSLRDAARWRGVRVGEPIIRVWKPGEPAPALVRLRGPEGLRATLRVEGRKAEYAETREPGLYFLEGSDGEAEAFAVNLDRATGESELAPAARPPWRPLRPEAAREDFLRALYGREARTGTLALALLLLVAEALLARPGRRRETGSVRPVAAALAVLLLLAAPARAQEGDRFVWSQLRYEGHWDPYPSVHGEILNFVGTVTSVLFLPERRVLRLRDPELFSSPFVLLTGRNAPPPLDDDELRRLRDYLVAGGFLWIEDASGQRVSAFDSWVRRTLRNVFPDAELAPLGQEHVVHRTFFLLRGVGGRVSVSPSLEGIQWAGRTAVLYSRNDVLGAWAKDALGNHLYDCVPGGDAQRAAARKLALNIVMYSLTGNYKTDAVHQPYLLEKMRSGQP